MIFSAMVNPSFLISWVARNIPSPRIEPTTGVTMRSLMLGCSYQLSMKYSNAVDMNVEKRKEYKGLSP